MGVSDQSLGKYITFILFISLPSFYSVYIFLRYFWTSYINLILIKNLISQIIWICWTKADSECHTHPLWARMGHRCKSESFDLSLPKLWCPALIPITYWRNWSYLVPCCVPHPFVSPEGLASSTFVGQLALSSVQPYAHHILQIYSDIHDTFSLFPNVLIYFFSISMYIYRWYLGNVGIKTYSSNQWLETWLTENIFLFGFLYPSAMRLLFVISTFKKKM